MNTNREQLRVSGLRATPQRILVLRILQEAGEHLDAETIWLRSRQHDPAISLATVYRSLARLKDASLVTQRFYDRDHKRECFAAVNQEERFFFTCRSCKRVLQLRTPLLAQLRRQWEQELGLVFLQGCMCFDGYCAECAPQRIAESGTATQTDLLNPTAESGGPF